MGEVQDGRYDVSMSIDWHFKDGVTEDAKIANKETNTRTVYFDLLTEGTEELVYSSPYIPVSGNVCRGDGVFHGIWNTRDGGRD